MSAYDPWRITVDVQQLSRTGFEVEQMLQDIHMVFPEMATHKVSSRWTKSLTCDGQDARSL